MVSGLTGRTTSWPPLKAAATGEQPCACAPKIVYGASSTSPSETSSAKPLSTFVSCEPDATGITTWSRQPPAELLGDLVAQRLGALGVVGPDVDVDERPALLLAGDLRREPVDVVVVALHGHQRAAVHRGGDDLGALEVLGDEDHGLHAGAGAGRGDRVGEVAGRGAREDVAPNSRAADSATATTRSLKECVGLPESSFTHSERMPSSRAEVVGLEQPGEAGLHVAAAGDVGGHREQRLVAPDVLGAGLDLLAGHRREVVADLERAEALLTRVERAERLGGATLAADQPVALPKAPSRSCARSRCRTRTMCSRRPPSHLPRGPTLGAGRI